MMIFEDGESEQVGDVHRKLANTSFSKESNIHRSLLLDDFPRQHYIANFTAFQDSCNVITVFFQRKIPFPMTDPWVIYEFTAGPS